MVRTDLIRLIVKNGFELSRHGGNHDVYIRGTEMIVVPRHREINERLAKSIIKKWGLK